MFKVDTPDGERFLVQLVGPRSYRMGNQVTYKGQTLPVSKRTRDYLVRKTNGAWVDYDPTPVEPVEEILPPQFGEPGGPMIDMADIDPSRNPALSLEHAQLLASRALTGAIPEHSAYAGDLLGDAGPDIADLSQKPLGKPLTDSGSGDMTAADLKGAVSPAKPMAPAKATVKINPSKEAAAVPAGATVVE